MEKQNVYNKIIAVTNRRICSGPLTGQVSRICKLNPKAVILREKDLPQDEYEKLAEQVYKICSENNVMCILHSFPNVAKRIGCDAIHMPMPLLRKRPETVNEFGLVGTSVHSVSEAIEAQKMGVSYISAGHIFNTDCKKGVPPRGTGFLREVCQSVNIPVYAIGGIKISSEQMAEIESCGAAGGCVMSEMLKL